MTTEHQTAETRADPLEELRGVTVGAVVDALHEAQIGCYELAHWETPGAGDPDDHLEDANRFLASLLAALTPGAPDHE